MTAFVDEVLGTYACKDCDGRYHAEDMAWRNADGRTGQCRPCRREVRQALYASDPSPNSLTEEDAVDLQGMPAHADCAAAEEDTSHRLRVAAVDRAVGDQVRVAQAELARRLRALATEAADVADALALAGPSDRVTTCLAGRYESVRHAITMLEAARTGAYRMREQVRADA